MFTNLIINSIEAMPSGGTLSVGCEQRPGRVIAFVEDTGQGIPDDQKQHIFSPYFTTKEGGTGLGLAGAERLCMRSAGRSAFKAMRGWERASAWSSRLNRLCTRSLRGFARQA